MKGLALLLALVVAGSAGAVVIRDDVGDLRYRMAAADFPALADLPVEGHGVLIAPRWVVTAAHAVAWQPAMQAVVIGGVPREVEQVILHPGYRTPPQPIIDDALKTGAAAGVVAILAGSDDIALVKLAAPVSDIAPVAIHPGPEPGARIEIIGKGATGTGAQGHSPHGPNRTDLRHAFSALTASEGRWLTYVFRQGAAALPLEGSAGNGDSGGPLLVGEGAARQLAGLTSWKDSSDGKLVSQPGRYGQVNRGLRLAHYLDWIRSTMARGGA